jgi:hypothetical protein
LLIGSHRAFFAESIVAIAAPRPLFWFLRQPSGYGIAVHVAQLLDALARRPYVEVVEAALPCVLGAFKAIC